MREVLHICISPGCTVLLSHICPHPNRLQLALSKACVSGSDLAWLSIRIRSSALICNWKALNCTWTNWITIGLLKRVCEGERCFSFVCWIQAHHRWVQSASQGITHMGCGCWTWRKDTARVTVALALLATCANSSNSACITSHWIHNATNLPPCFPWQYIISISNKWKYIHDMHSLILH